MRIGATPEINKNKGCDPFGQPVPDAKPVVTPASSPEHTSNRIPLATLMGLVRPKVGVTPTLPPAVDQPPAPLATFRNEEDGTEVFITQGAKGFHVSMKDIDSGEFLLSVKICPTRESADEIARKWARVEPALASAPAPDPPLHTITEKTLSLPDGELNRVAADQNGLIIRLREGSTKAHDGMHPLPVLDANLEVLRKEQERRMNQAADDQGLPRPGFDWVKMEGGLKPGTVTEDKAGMLHVLNRDRRWEAMSEGQRMAYNDPSRREAFGFLPLLGEAKVPSSQLQPQPRKVSADPDDPNSPSYRFRDTGYVPGSRKELAADMIRRVGRTGGQVKVTDIDWAGLEANPREAKELVTKSNMFGKVDWEKLRAEGMEPGAGFLIDRIYASVGAEPSEDSPRARHDYAFGLQTLREKLEVCKSPTEVGKALDELSEEFRGYTLNPAEAKAMASVRALETVAFEKTHAFYDGENRFSLAATRASCALSEVLSQQAAREKRGWKPDPELAAKIPELQAAKDVASKALEEFREAHPEFKQGYREAKRYGSPMDMERSDLRRQRDMIHMQAQVRNLAENDFHRGLNTMGERFFHVLQFRSRSGSKAFANHMAVAEAGKIKDWEWTEKDQAPAVPRATQESVKFQLRVADNFERVGGRTVKVESTEDIKRLFNLREVQSGLYVLGDYNAAKFHVEKSAEAFADMADVLGVPDNRMGIQGELAMAYGARGKGNAGWHGAAAAEYSPTYRIMNLTKEKGGSCLGHEWFHAEDNLIAELETGKPVSKGAFVTENPDLLPDGKLKDAVKNLVATMWAGDKRITQTLTYTALEYDRAQRELTGYASQSGLRAEILTAGSIEKAIDHIKARYPVRDKDDLVHAPKWEQTQNRRNANQQKAFINVAAAWYGGKPEGGEIKAPMGRTMSSFAFEAHRLDAGRKTPYWSTTRELAARAFHSYLEDRLQDMGRQNDYLAAFGDNKYYVDPLFGPQRPYPEGEERTRINEAFDRFVAALRESKFAAE